MLAEFLALDLFHFMMVFARVGAALMLFPGIGSTMFSQRARLLLGLAICVVVTPVVAPLLPAKPASPIVIALYLLGEVTVGVFFGMLVQTLLAAATVAGSFIAMQTGLSNAFTYDPIAQNQSALLTGFLTQVAMILMFITETHHMMLRAVVDSYQVFVAGRPLPFGDWSDFLSHALSKSFAVGIELAAPLVVFGLLFYVAMGLLARIAPQVQVFFVILPLQIFFGLVVLMIMLPTMMVWLIRHIQEGLMPFIGG